MCLQAQASLFLFWSGLMSGFFWALHDLRPWSSNILQIVLTEAVTAPPFLVQFYCCFLPVLQVHPAQVPVVSSGVHPWPSSAAPVPHITGLTEFLQQGCNASRGFTNPASNLAAAETLRMQHQDPDALCLGVVPCLGHRELGMSQIAQKLLLDL